MDDRFRRFFKPIAAQPGDGVANGVDHPDRPAVGKDIVEYVGRLHAQQPDGGGGLVAEPVSHRIQRGRAQLEMRPEGALVGAAPVDVGDGALNVLETLTR